MTKDTIINYSYVLLDEYKDLEDGTTDFHYIPAIRVNNQGTLIEFLELLSCNSKIEGVSIKEINFTVVEDDDT